ncbi:MAG TPA: hypothetical protein DCO75_11835, partial [Fibrobacteres bacterium]|nr:hypothetical protein [Fibrobacterota bacterium]
MKPKIRSCGEFGFYDNKSGDFMSKYSVIRLFVFICVLILCRQSVFAQAGIRVDKSYEDSVRIVILWNNPVGSCSWMDSVGAQTRKFVTKSISDKDDSANVVGYIDSARHVKILPITTNSAASATWTKISSLWGGDTLPHVIVHVNAGWYSGYSEKNIQTIYDSATAKYIGIVEVGDDAVMMAQNVFGLTNSSNSPVPIGDGTSYTSTTDTMLIGLYPNRDSLVDSTTYPYLKGIIRNTTRILGGNRVDFKPYNASINKDSIRCQADADQYDVQPAYKNKLTFLGYQDVSRNGTMLVGSSKTYSELDVIVAFQDTINASSKKNMAVRRAVALSMQPQFLKNTHAMYQLVYDAVMFSSLAWQLRPVDKMTIEASNDTIKAGDTTNLTATLYRDGVVDTTSIKDSVKWKLDSSTIKNGDWISGVKGQAIKISGTVAYRSIGVIASYIDATSGNTIIDTVQVYVLPNIAYRIYIVGANDTVRTASNQNSPNPLSSITLDSATNYDTVYAVIYDEYGNWVSKANSAAWNSLDTSVVKAVAVTGRNFAGAVERITKEVYTDTITASQTGLLSDSLPVILQKINVDSISITAGSDTIKAGDTTKLTATLYREGVAVTSSIKDSVRWQLDSSTIKAGDWISGNKGQSVLISGTVAYRQITVIASYKDASSGKTITDTVSVYVKPNSAYRIYIVGANDTVRTTRNQNNPTLLDYITLDSATNYDTVYAVTYDKYGNWTGQATNAVWSSLNTSVVKAWAVTGRNFAGVIMRNTKDPDTAYITASQSTLVPDSLLVILRTDKITAIRIVQCDGITVVDSVNITTDETRCLQIQVKWSNDTSKWVDGAGSWTLSKDSITWLINVPVGSQTGKWTLDPVTAGSDSLTVTAGGKTVTIQITVTEADPSKIKLAILTPDSLLIAGDTILVESRIYNTDGLVSGTWCNSVVYGDTFPTDKTDSWTPIAKIDDKDSLILGSTIGQECFTDGIDTIKVVLYDASYTQDTLHKLWVLLTTSGGKLLKDSTNSFVLLPGPLDSIAIEDVNFKSIDGPVTLAYPAGSIFFYSNGYDMYDNLIGHINTTWAEDGTLHPIDSPNINIYRIYYSASSNDESGYITTQVKSGVDSNVTLYDSVEVKIKGSSAIMDSAITRDENGNGYLDHIYFYFSKPVIIDTSYKISGVTVRYNTYYFNVKSIRAVDTTEKAYIIYLQDTINADRGVITADFPSPQTGWRPYLIMSKVPVVDSINVKCRDGAGPVIWRVVV